MWKKVLLKHSSYVNKNKILFLIKKYIFQFKLIYIKKYGGLKIGKEITVKKDGNSLKIIFPAQIAEMYNIKVGSQLDLDPMGSDSFRVKVVKE